MSDRTQSNFARGNDAKDQIAMIASTFEQQRDKYLSLLPSSVPVDVFRNAFIIAIQQKPALLVGDRKSLWLALQKAASDGLMPDGREGALVTFNDDDDDGKPRGGGKQKMVTWMPMTWGILKTVRQAKEVKSVTVELVYRGEHVKIVLGDEPRFEHERSTAPDFDDSVGNMIGAYAIVVYQDGAIEREWMSRAKLDKIKAFSKAKNGPWKSWPEEQYRKTVLRRLSKRLERSATRRLDTLLARDETIGADPDDIEGHAVELNEIAPKAEEPQQFREQQPRPVQDVTEEPETENPTPNASPSGSIEPEPTETQSEAGSPAEFSAFPIDEHGEPIAEETNDPVAFANWFYNAMQDSKNPDALREHNMDAIGDASANPKARAILETATLAAKPPAPDSKLFVPLPRTASGAANLPQYINDCRGVLATLKTPDAINEWVSANQATYAGKAFETPVIRILQEFRDRFLQAENAPTADEFRAALKAAKTTEDVRLARLKYGKWIESLKNTNAGLYAELMRDSEMRVAELI